MFLKNVALTSGVAAAFMLAGASAASAFTACQVTDVGGIDDSGFNQTAWKGVQDSMAAYGIDGRYLESQSETDYEPNLNALLDAKCDIIISVGFLMADATATSANANPGAKFSIVDMAYNPTIPNVLGMVYATNEPLFHGWISCGRHVTDRRGRHIWRHQHSAGHRLHGRLLLRRRLS